MPSARAAIVSIAFVASCTSTVDVAVEAPPDDARSTIIALVRADVVQVYGGDVVSFGLPTPLDDGDLVFVAYYAESLEERGVPVVPGQLTRLATDEDGLALGGFLAAWTQRLGDDARWRSSPTLPSALASVRLRIARSECQALSSPPVELRAAPCSARAILAPTAPAAVLPVAPPRFTCARGEDERPDLAPGLTTCRPFDPPSPRCADIERIDGEACVPIGDCTSSNPPPDAIHVAPDASGGDGTSAAPYSLGEAVAVAGDGDALALAAGTYAAERWALPRGASVFGRCASQTILVATDIDLGADVRDLTLRASTVRIASGDAVDVDDAIVDAPSFIVEGTLRLRRSRVLGRDDVFTSLVAVVDGEATLQDVTLAGARGNGLYAERGTVTLRRVTVRDIGADTDGSAASGVRLAQGSRAVFEHVTIDAVEGVGILVFDSELDADALAVRSSSGVGIEIVDASVVSARDVHVDGASTAAIRATGGASLELDGAVIGGVVDELGDNASIALVGAEADIAGLHLRTASIGVRAVSGSDLTLTDVVVEGAPGPIGVLVELGSTAKITRGIVADLARFGAVFVGADTIGDLTDVAVARIANGQPSGIGIVITASAAMTAERLEVGDVDGRGIEARSAASVTLAELTVRDVRSTDEAQQRDGSCVEIANSMLGIRGASIEGCANYVLLASDTPTRLSDIRATTTLGNPGIYLTAELDAPEVPVALARVALRGPDGPPAPDGPSFLVTLDFGPVVAAVTDLEITNAEAMALRILTEDRLAQLARVEILDTKGKGIEVGRDANAAFTDLRVRGSISVGGRRSAGINTRSAALTLRRFLVSDIEGAAFRIETELSDKSLSDLEDGTIADSGIALSVPGIEATKLKAKDVSFRGNVLDVFVP